MMEENMDFCYRIVSSESGYDERGNYVLKEIMEKCPGYDNQN